MVDIYIVYDQVQNTDYETGYGPMEQHPYRICPSLEAACQVVRRSIMGFDDRPTQLRQLRSNSDTYQSDVPIIIRWTLDSNSHQKSLDFESIQQCVSLQTIVQCLCPFLKTWPFELLQLVLDYFPPIIRCQA